MDTTSLYVKMCEMASELQSSWVESPGDFFIWSQCEEEFADIDKYAKESSDHDGELLAGKHPGEYDEEYFATIQKDPHKRFEEWKILHQEVKDRQLDEFTVKTSEDGYTSENLKRDEVVDRFVWLFRLDQLIEMLDCNSNTELIFKLAEFIKFAESDALPLNKTMEPLLLSLVMKLRYDKKWDGNQWII